MLITTTQWLGLVFVLMSVCFLTAYFKSWGVRETARWSPVFVFKKKGATHAEKRRVLFLALVTIFFGLLPFLV